MKEPKKGHWEAKREEESFFTLSEGKRRKEERRKNERIKEIKKCSIISISLLHINQSCYLLLMRWKLLSLHRHIKTLLENH